METKLATATTKVTPTERKENLEGLLTKELHLESSRPDPIQQAGYRIGETQILITGIGDSTKTSAESRRYMVNVFQPSVGHSHFLVDSSGNITHSKDNGISPSTQNLDTVIHGLSLNQRVGLKEIQQTTGTLRDRLLPELKV